MANTGIKRLEMKLRLNAPEFVRKIYRLMRGMQTPIPSKTLPTELIHDCRLANSRRAMLGLLPKNGRVAELGTYKGQYARQILDLNSPTELHVIDINYSHFDMTLLEDRRVTRHQGLTVKEIGKFPDSYFDWIYVDAGHSYDDVIADARASATKLRQGGYLVFNDFGQIDPFLGRYGVHRAVTDFVVEYRWPLRFLSLQEYAMYDVALQKP
jgi:hypothetical protein